MTPEDLQRWANLTIPPEEIAKAIARADQMQAAEHKRLQEQHQRRSRLTSAEPSIRRALEAYGQLDDGTVDVVRIRRGAVRLQIPREARPDPHTYSWADDAASRPPLTRLTTRSRHSLKLLLSLIYVAHLEHSTNDPFTNSHPNTSSTRGNASWLDLSGMWQKTSGTPASHRRAQRRRLTTALDNLVENNIVSLTGPVGVTGRYKNFHLLEETGSGTSAPYRVPGAWQDRPRDAVVSIPADFFRHGWHLVLTDQEIVTLFAIIDRTRHLRDAKRGNADHDVGVDLKESVRWSEYGVSERAYSSVRMLAAFDCIDLIDPMPNRRSRTTITPVPFPSADPDSHSSGSGEEEAREGIVNLADRRGRWENRWPWPRKRRCTRGTGIRWRSSAIVSGSTTASH